jgi:RND family efflux transporter MFP subunit
MKNRFPNPFAALIAIAASTGCAKKNEFVPPPPPEVGVQTPKVETTTVYSEYSGRTSGSSRVEIRARVKGFLKDTHFDAGQFVEKGQLLFTIEPEQFEAAVATAKGNLAKAQADLEIATTNWQKLKKAFEASGAVSEIDVLSAEAEKKAADAGVMIAKAALDNANRDKGYTEIHAPVSGRVSNAQVDQGNLVGAADPTLLTDIVTVRPIYFNFEASEREVLRYLGDMPNAKNPTGSGKAKELDLELVLADGTPFEETGRFDFADNSIDPNSGTLRLRAVFDNEKGLLVDGLFARIRIPEKVENAVIVPAQAIQRDLGGSFVLVVNESDVVERRAVVPTTLEVGGGNKIIESFDESTGSGLQSSDRFVVSNLQRAREGLTVRPVEPGGEASGSAAPEPAVPSGEKTSGEPAGEPVKAKAE